MSTESKDGAPKLVDFLRDGYVLIVEPSANFSASLQHCLTQLGVKAERIMTARRLDQAEQMLNDRKPRLLVTEYDIPPGFGLSLVELQDKFYDETERIALVVTKNSSDSAVAESAEGTVDGFILKPFSIDVFRTKLAQVLKSKLNPNPYRAKVFEGRKHLLASSYDLALACFAEAKALIARPSLACYFSGEAYLRMGKKTEAIAEFRQGRAHQPLHYKSLVGEFEILMEQKRFAEVCELAPVFVDNFPLTANRMGQIFIATTVNQKFDDLISYFEHFQKIELRTPRLVEIVSVSMLTAGRFSLNAKDVAKAMGFFEMGILARGKEIDFLEKIIDDLIACGAINEADQVFSKIPPSHKGSGKYNQLRFKIDRMLLPPEQLVDRARKIVFESEATPEMFRILVDLTARAGKETLAETIISKAREKFPALAPELYALLERPKIAS